MAFTRVVAITGCDSGLGWALAARSAREGLVTVAGMYHGTQTDAAEALKKMRAYPCHLDVTDTDSIKKFKTFVNALIKKHPDYTLYAVVNNAGIMTIGDYEWQTGSMIENTINTNLLGAMRVVSAFLPDLRKAALKDRTRPRIINVASHCALQPLPGFAAYSTSKAGLLALTKSLRFECHPHGLAAVNFLPGGFFGSSKIMTQQISHGMEMLKHLDDEQKAFYGKRLVALNDYFAAIPHGAQYDSLKDENIIALFMKALLEENPKELYIEESWRYMFYYNLLRLPFPEYIRHWLIKKFTNIPDS